ncbi:unnamed protein product [Prunus armeniaca]
MMRCRKASLKLNDDRARGCRRQHQASMSQGKVARHEGAGGNTKLACRKAMWLDTKVPKGTQSLRVARRCD